MVVIRLARGGAKNQPCYYIVVTDRRKPRDGGYIECVGFFNIVAKGGSIRLRLNQKSINQWLKKGAKPSERVQQLIKEFAKTGEITGAAYRESLSARKPKQVTETANINQVD